MRPSTLGVLIAIFVFFSLITVAGPSANAQSFVLTSSLNTGRELATATLLNNGIVLIAGGYGTGGVVGTAELYNPATGTFTLTGSLNTPRYVHTAALLGNGMVLITGGIDSSSAVLSSAELYDPSTGTFIPTGALNQARFQQTATLLSNGMVLIAGGNSELSTSVGFLSSAELYDPGTGTFSFTSSLNVPRYQATATLLKDSRVLIAGGYNGNNGFLTDAELYDFASGTFSPTGSLNTPRESHTATLLNNGTVLIAGGASPSVLSSAELYDPVAGQFTAANSMNVARLLHAATILNDGTVLIVGGGRTSNSGLASAELFNPATGTFALTVNMNSARVNQTATPLNNGTVLIAGGVDANGNVLASTELYKPIDDDSQFSELTGGNVFTGNQTINGNVNATNFVGNGSGLTNVNASMLAGVPAYNYARLDIPNIFNGNQKVSGSLSATVFAGDGSGLTNITAASANSANFALSAGDAMTLGRVNAGNYARLDINNSFSGNQNVGGDVNVTGRLNGSALNLPSTSSSTVGVITLGSVVLHTFGNSNTFAGQSAGNFTMSGALNTGIGIFALQSTTTGSQNTGTGVEALLDNTTGSYNTAAGYQALDLNTTGSGNTAVGFEAAISPNPSNAITTGSNNTFIGYRSGPGTSTQLTNASAIGANAVVSSNNAMVLGDGSINVGIGTQAPGKTLDVVGEIRSSGTVTASSFAGDGSHLTGVVATNATTSNSLSCTGCVSNTMLATPSISLTAGAGLSGGGTLSLGGTGSLSLATNTCAAGSAVTAHPFTCSPFAILGPNVFTGTQAMPALTVSGTGTFGSTGYSGNGVVGFSGSGMGVVGNSTTGYGVSGTSSNLGVVGFGTSGAGVEGVSNNGYGIEGGSTSWVGVYGSTQSSQPNAAAAMFVNAGPTNSGNIIFGQYQGANEFIVDAKGDVTANGNVAAGGSVSIGGGTPIAEYVSTSLTTTLSALASQSCTTYTTAALNGFTTGSSDTIALGIPGGLASAYALTFQAWETTAGVSPKITIRVCNFTGSRYGGSGTASYTIGVDIFKH